MFATNDYPASLTVTDKDPLKPRGSWSEKMSNPIAGGGGMHMHW